MCIMYMYIVSSYIPMPDEHKETNGPEKARSLKEHSGSVEAVVKDALVKTTEQNGVKRSTEDDGKPKEAEFDPEKIRREYKELDTIDSLFTEQKVVAYGIQSIMFEVFKSMEDVGGADTPFTARQRQFTLKTMEGQLTQMESDQNTLKRSLDETTRPIYIKGQNLTRFQLLTNGLSAYASRKETTDIARREYKLLMNTLFDYAFGATTEIHAHKEDSASKKIIDSLSFCKKLYELALLDHPTRSTVEGEFASKGINPGAELKKEQEQDVTASGQQSSDDSDTRDPHDASRGQDHEGGDAARSSHSAADGASKHKGEPRVPRSEYKDDALSERQA